MPHMSHRTCLGVLALLVTSTFVPRASPAQFLDPDTKVFCWHCNSHNSHFIGGATVDAALHVMPFVKKSWETPAGRIAPVAIGGDGSHPPVRHRPAGTAPRLAASERASADSHTSTLPPRGLNSPAVRHA